LEGDINEPGKHLFSLYSFYAIVREDEENAFGFRELQNASQ
jgi:hypothetical protein